MKRITDSQIVKHADGSSHEQLYCFGHLWGPAYFRKDSADYKEYISIVQKLKAYEDTGLEPGEVQYLKDKSEPRMVRWTPAYQSYYSAGDEAECFCPVCDSDVVEDDDYFCPTCGQALKYHDEPN